MDLFEYQAKELFAKHNVPTTPGRVTDTAEDAKAIAEEIGRPVMVKAQVKAGGRGKAGGVKFAATPEDAYTHAKNILGLDIKGHIVKKLLVAEASDIAEEYYISFLLDRSNRTYLAMCSVEGGMEIEEVAATKPERLAKVSVDAVKGVDLATARSIAEQGHLPAEVLDAAAVTIQKLWEVFVGEDATLVEVNPLVRTPDDQILALDGKVTLDENADFRQPGHVEFEDRDATDPLELKAKENDLNYVKLDGAVGIIGNGAGLVMSTLDVVAYAGENHGGVKPANFLDIGGGASAEVMAAGLDVILHDPDVKSRIEGAIAEVKEALKGTEADPIRAATEKLNEAWQSVSDELYKAAAEKAKASKAQAHAGPAGGGEAPAEDKKGPDEGPIIDAEVVDDKK